MNSEGALVATNSPGFIHLRVHSAYSLLEGALPIKKLVALAEKDRMPALALTDRNNLFGALEFSESLKGAGIQPIVGCTLAMSFEEALSGQQETAEEFSVAPKEPEICGSIALIAKDENGYENLMALSSTAFKENADTGAVHVTLGDLKAHAQGLIVLTGGPDGPIDLALERGDNETGKRWLLTLKEIFADGLYVELQRHGTRQEREVEPRLVELAYALDLPLVATNQAYFEKRTDFDAHDALLCISEGRYVSEDDRRRLTKEHYFKTRDEMMKLFADLPEALENTVEIARRVSYRPLTRDPILPTFVDEEARNGAEGDALVAAEAAELRRQSEEGLKARLDAQGLAPGYERKDYEERLAYELDIIERMKFPGYFLIVSDFIKWTKSQDIPVGPGRGSGAGSIVAWVLTITDLDPLRFALLFERFLNPERVSMPDFDIDFCQERRDEVIRYVQEKYGSDRVAQIITFGKLQARAVLRDVGRVLQMPYGQVDRLCKLVPNNPANPVTLAEAIEGEPALQEARDAEPIVKQLLDIGKKLEGLYRHASTHAAGVVIGDRPLHELVALYQDPRSDLPATQFNMKWVEPAGLVKFDFLGLKTLTVIQHAVELLKAKNIDIDMSLIPLDDKKTYEMLSRGETVGVFQFESAGMRDLLRQAEPDRVEDLIALVALFRPGPMENIPKYLASKHGREEKMFLHDLVTHIVDETYGVIIYQEQVMQIAQVLSGYSLGEADLLRRAMGKKIKAEMDKQKARFVEGAVQNGVDKKDADNIFEMVAKFAGYGFNKSHSACYALVAYQTAYLKANYPVEFMSAIMTLDQGNTDKINIFCQAAEKMEIGIKPPCVNSSLAEFAPEDGDIRFSMAALKNVGQSAVEHICEERDVNGPFKSLTDFAERINPRAVNKRALETLSAAGAFDCLDANRAVVFNNIDRILGAANRAADDKAKGQNDLFGGAGEQQALALRPTEAWLPMDKLTREFDAVGFFLSGHPLDEYDAVLGKLGAERWLDFEKRIHDEGTSTGLLAGTVTYRQERTSKSGNKFAFCGMSDQTGQFEAVVFSETLSESRELLEPGTPVMVRLEGELDGENMRTRILSVEALDRAAARVQHGLRVRLGSMIELEALKDRLPGQGKGEIIFVLSLDEMEREVEMTMPGQFNVGPREASKLRNLQGVLEVQEY